MGYKNNKSNYDLDVEALFENEGALTGSEELEPVFDIDIEGMEREADNLAANILQNVAKVYSSETFLKDNPEFKKRLDSEIQSLKMLLKMRAIDDKVQDELARAISRKADNASLYAALPKHQTSMINIQNKIDSTMDRIQKMLEGYQTEMSFDDEDDENEEEPHAIHSSRGSRDFIMMMKDRSASDIITDDPESAVV